MSEPIRKSSLPTTPPPENEFHTVVGGQPDNPGVLLFPGDEGPVVVRRRVTYGDWEPVRPDHWADESEPSAGLAATGTPQPGEPAKSPLRGRIAEALLDHLSRTADIRPGRSGELAFMLEVTDQERLRIADAVLTVLDPQGDTGAAIERGHRCFLENHAARLHDVEEALAARRGMVSEAEAAVARVRALHRPVDYNGTLICADCSGYDGSTCDNSPCGYEHCPTIAALDGKEVDDVR
ncbi:hypothetical protein [Streptomyces prasinus]|uniref:hypothetical protein n=1 Tax=Streptomyces prasinus TaxID=67345 RepID=UPI0033AC3438